MYVYVCICLLSIPVSSFGFEWPITEQALVSPTLWVQISVSVVTGPSQVVHASSHLDLKALGAAVWALSTVAGEVAGLVELNGAVGFIVQVGRQRVLLLGLEILDTFMCQEEGEG